MNGLREYIRFLLEAEKRDDGKEILGEPDESEEEEYHADEQSAGGVPGATTPLGTGPTYPADDRRKKKSTGPKTKKDKK